MSLTIEVIPTMDSRAVDTKAFENPQVYTKVFEEKMPPVPPACFLGAYYRKVVSSFDKWLGIVGIIKLGEFIPDKDRFNLDGNGRYMDNPSVYMGGKSQKESDAGLGYNLMYSDSDTSYELTLSSPKYGYRPFWRYIYSEAQDTNGNVRRREVNSWNISYPKSFCYYYFPGDVVEMSVYSPIKDYLQLRIKVLEVTTIPKYVELRKKYHLVNDMPSDFYSPLFYSKGHGEKDAEFKRVNSIDQYGNEGYNAKPTKAMMTEAEWKEVYLYRKIDGIIYKVPFTPSRQSSNICPNTKLVTVSEQNNQGGEKIVIHPGVENE